MRLKPPVKPATGVLWFGPFAVLALAAAGVLLDQVTANARPAPLDPTERQQLDRLLLDENHQELPKA